MQARIAAASQLLDQLKTDGSNRYTMMSHLQSDALIEALQDIKNLTGLERADITQAVMAVPWAEEKHGDMVVDALTNRPKPLPANARRKQQDFEALFNYLSSSEWDKMNDKDLYAACDLIIGKGIACECVNPTEPTYKSWATGILSLKKNLEEAADIPTVTKYTVLDYIKANHKKITRRIKGKLPSYHLWLPSIPDDLRAIDQALYMRIFPAGVAPVANQINQEVANLIDKTYQCRGYGCKQATPSQAIQLANAGVPQSLDIFSMLQGPMMQMFQRMQSQQQSQNTIPGLSKYGPGQQRSFSALRGNEGMLDRFSDGNNFMSGWRGGDQHPSANRSQTAEGNQAPIGGGQLGGHQMAVDGSAAPVGQQQQSGGVDAPLEQAAPEQQTATGDAMLDAI